MRSFYAGTALVMLVLLFMTWRWRPDDAEVSTFYGIVDTTETIVSAEIAVEIGRVHVAPGQRIRAGDTLVSLASAELEKSIAELRYGLNEARANRIAGDREIQAKVSELEAQYNLNRRLLAQVRGAGDDAPRDDRDEAGPLRAAIAGLKDLLAREEASAGDMEAYLALLIREREKLTVLSRESGVIGSVNHRKGEKVQAFLPILTLHNGSPSSVRGYIHESAHGRVEFGRKVRVRSLASPHEITGEIAGVGHRIIEYPLRLRKRPDIQIWGREVIVRIPPGNAFLLGEKVMITVDLPRRGGGADRDSRTVFPGLAAHAAEAPAPDAVWELPGVEPSGLVFLPDLAKLLVVSDDTPKKRPLLHLVDAAGRVEGLLEIRGLPAINDMEAIAQDAAGRLHIAASQSRNKSGNLPGTRRLLVRAAREGTAVRLEASVSLYDALEAAAREARGDWADWLRGAMRDQSLDMEGIALHEEGLLLGFKAPLWRDRAVILRVHDREGLLAGRPPGADGVSLWRAVDLPLDDPGVSCGISDLFFHEGVLHILGTSVVEDGRGTVSGGGGGWWVLDPEGGAARRARAFPGMKPEGIAFDPVAGVFRIAFDNGASRPGTVLSARLPAE